MAPADTLSPPGSSSYSSDTLHVGDGTWDFTKDTFLLPNLVGLNFDTMRYNGMGNRFSTLTQYHRIIVAHGVLAVIAFLFLIPAAVMLKRFRRAPADVTTRHHAYLHVLALGLVTVVFILGFLAVGPPRSLSNPHHGLGVAIYVLLLLQAVGGRMVRRIRGPRSLRLHLHRWNGRAVALLGIVQVPLGLTLYGSPKFTFVLYALWMAFLLLLYFVLSYTHDGERGDYVEGYDRRSRKSGGGGGALKWLAPLAAGAGAWALLRSRRKKDRDVERSVSRSRSRSRVRSRSRSRPPEVIASRRGSDSYVEYEKDSDHRPSGGGGGGFMGKMLGVGTALGAGALAARFLGRGRDKKGVRDEEYSAVATDTPSRPSRSRRYRPAAESEYSDYTEEVSTRPGRSTLLPGPGPAAAASADPRAGPPPARPMTPVRSHPGQSRMESGLDYSDYSSYVSPSRRVDRRDGGGGGGGGGIGKGLLAGVGLGWLAKKWRDRQNSNRGGRDDRYEEELDRRAGRREPRYTGDGYPTPSRRLSRRATGRPVPPPSGVTATDLSGATDESSTIEPRPPRGYGDVSTAAYPPPRAAGGPPPPHRAAAAVEPVSMPPMPPDPHGVLHDSDSYLSRDAPPSRRRSSRRRREGQAAAAAAADAGSRLAASEERRHHHRRASLSSSPPPVGVSVKVHDQKGSVTLRRLTEEEQARRERRRRRGDSVSSSESPSGRYRRRDTSRMRSTAAAESAAGPAEDEPLAPLSPPNPAFASGGRRAAAAGGGSAMGGTPAAGTTVSSLGSPLGSYGSPSLDPADRRRRRRLERRDASRQSTTVDYT